MFFDISITNMNKNTSILMVAAVAGILVAAALAVTMTNVAFARSKLAIDQAEAMEALVELAELAV